MQDYDGGRDLLRLVCEVRFLNGDFGLEEDRCNAESCCWEWEGGVSKTCADRVTAKALLALQVLQAVRHGSGDI